MLHHRDQHLDGHPAPLADSILAGLTLLLALLAWGVVLALLGA